MGEKNWFCSLRMKKNLNVQNYKDLYGRKKIGSVAYECKRI